MQKVNILLLFFFLSLIALASNESKSPTSNTPQKEFNGILEYVEYTPFDTTFFKVYVSNNKIRVDSYKNKKSKRVLEKILIYNLKNKNVVVLKPSEKKYRLLDVNVVDHRNTEGCKMILNKNNYKYINGYKCIQYRVKNISENTDITYWIPEEDFPFYYEMISMKRSMLRVYKYFFMLPNYKVAFPMQTVERGLLREEKSSYKVVGLAESKVSSSIFEIPKGYTLNE